MISQKKGDLSLQLVVAAIILLVVLVVVIMIFMQQTGKGAKGYEDITTGVLGQHCGIFGGVCVETADCTSVIDRLLTKKEDKDKYNYNHYQASESKYKDCRKNDKYGYCCIKEKK